jgi:hypothetical protein
VLHVEPGHSDVKCTCKPGKRASSSPARSVRRVPDEECKCPIDYLLLADITSTPLLVDLRRVGSAYDLFNGREHLADLDSSKTNRPEDARTAEHIPGDGVPTQPMDPCVSRMKVDAPWTAHLHVLSLEQDTISALTLFAKPTGPQLFDTFGLPLILPDTASIESLRAIARLEARLAATRHRHRREPRAGCRDS